MKVVIPMSGMSSRFADAGYTLPKYLIEVDGRKVIEHIVKLYPEDSEFVFIINDKHKTETDVVDILEKLVEKKTIVTIPRHKKGPVFSVSEFEHLIDDDEEVIVNYCDFSMYWDYRHFKGFVDATECDGCVVCYTGFHPHMLGSDNYAFCKTDDSNKILEIREKQPFTDNKMS
jgi:NDP-sugar pyrophosphorylase family protein